MKTVLDTIADQRKKDIDALKAIHPLSDFEKDLHPSERDFYHSLASNHPAFILECKKASPSRGLIRDDFNLAEIVRTYNPYASAISVLTEHHHFQGEYEYLTIVSRMSDKPILCKDFVVDPYQVQLARLYGADAILLMLSILDDERYIELRDLAHSLNMGVLTEVNNQREVERALYLEAKVIGINNRDLHDLSIDTDRTRHLGEMIPNDRIVISESGILNHQQVLELSPYANGFLIGSALMAENDLALATRQMVKGSHKVCGLTRREDVDHAYEAGATFGGMIFILTSPRGITIERAKMIGAGSPLRFIGVFQNDDIDSIVHIVNEVGLYGVQLHGRENQEFITKLRQALPKEVKIIRAIPVTDQLYPMDNSDVDFYLLDGKEGGSGKPFDWSLLKGVDLGKVILAGGLNEDNVADALSYQPYALDLNSGVESSPGIKESKKLHAIFKKIDKTNSKGARK